MRDKIIETVARGIAEHHIRVTRKWDTDPVKLQEMLPKSIDYAWPEQIEYALSAIRVLENAGYRIVEWKPTEEMLNAMQEPVPDYQEVESYYIWQAAFNAAPIYGEVEE